MVLTRPNSIAFIHPPNDAGLFLDGLVASQERQTKRSVAVPSVALAVLALAVLAVLVV
jgi:hypothetical protein